MRNPGFLKLVFVVALLSFVLPVTTSARWISVDPLAAKYPSVSPYVYALNNPLKYIDPDGRDAVPIVFKDYLVQTDNGPMPKLGHAGVLLIDNTSGFTRYFEYGRYNTPIGKAKTYRVPNVTMDSETGMPTAASLGRVLALIAKKSGQSGDITAAYIANDEFRAMVDYAESIMAQNSNKDRRKYDALTNNCTHFMKRVLEAGGVDTPWMLDPRPNSYIDELRDQYMKLQGTAEERWNDVYDASNN